MILKLARVDDLKGEPFTPPKQIFLNSTRVDSWSSGKPGVTMIRMASGHFWHVAIDPDDLAAAIDPENACPEPTRCSYANHYLAYGGPDLTHAGYHAAEKLGEQHMASCRRMERAGVCSTCSDWEQRLRA